MHLPFQEEKCNAKSFDRCQPVVIFVCIYSFAFPKKIGGTPVA